MSAAAPGRNGYYEDNIDSETEVFIDPQYESKLGGSMADVRQLGATQLDMRPHQNEPVGGKCAPAWSDEVSLPVSSPASRFGVHWHEEIPQGGDRSPKRS